MKVALVIANEKEWFQNERERINKFFLFQFFCSAVGINLQEEEETNETKWNWPFPLKVVQFSLILTKSNSG